MLHINETTDGPAEQARGRAAGVPGDRLRPALPHPRRAQRALPGHDARSTTTHGTDYHRAPSRLSAPRAGRGPDARRRHDRRQGRPHASGRTSRRTPTSTSTSSSATPGRHRDLAAPRRSSPARPTCTSSSSCRAGPWARRTPISPSAAPCRSMRRADHRRPARGPPRREAAGEVLRQIRPVAPAS